MRSFHLDTASRRDDGENPREAAKRARVERSKKVLGQTLLLLVQAAMLMDLSPQVAVFATAIGAMGIAYDLSDGGVNVKESLLPMDWVFVAVRLLLAVMMLLEVS